MLLALLMAASESANAEGCCCVSTIHPYGASSVKLFKPLLPLQVHPQALLCLQMHAVRSVQGIRHSTPVRGMTTASSLTASELLPWPACLLAESDLAAEACVPASLAAWQPQPACGSPAPTSGHGRKQTGSCPQNSSCFTTATRRAPPPSCTLLSRFACTSTPEPAQGGSTHSQVYAIQTNGSTCKGKVLA